MLRRRMKRAPPALTNHDRGRTIPACAFAPACTGLVSAITLVLAITSAAAQQPPSADEFTRQLQVRAHRRQRAAGQRLRQAAAARPEAYFGIKDAKDSDIVIALLRKVPTQSGVAYPKFYAWVEVTGARKAAGAVRLAAIDGEKFEVTDFLTRETIIAAPDRVRAVFPAALENLINERAAQSAAR
jgi:hypothetical protein